MNHMHVVCNFVVGQTERPISTIVVNQRISAVAKSVVRSRRDLGRILWGVVCSVTCLVGDWFVLYANGSL